MASFGRHLEPLEWIGDLTKWTRPIQKRPSMQLWAQATGSMDLPTPSLVRPPEASTLKLVKLITRWLANDCRLFNARAPRPIATGLRDTGVDIVSEPRNARLWRQVSRAARSTRPQAGRGLIWRCLWRPAASGQRPSAGEQRAPPLPLPRAQSSRATRRMRHASQTNEVASCRLMIHGGNIITG